MPRDYKRERALQLKSTKSNLSANASRKAARRSLEKVGKVKKGDGKDVHRKKGKARVMTASQNRGIREASRLKGSKRNV